jgi:RNA polymerase sigma-70 factor (ECF subfamily)
MNQPLIKPTQLTSFPGTILKGCREGNLQSQEQLYKYCYPDMIRVCYRYAGDMDGAGIIFNNAMLRVFRSLHQYKEEGKFLGWVKTIVTNCCLDFVKKQNKFRDEVRGNIEELEVSLAADAFSFVSAKEIQQMIRELPPATAVVFNLFIYEGYTHKQIGVSLGISEGTSKWHVNEGRKILKVRLEKFVKH